VAILGPQGAGKSSIAALFGEHRGYQRHGIADAIKHLANLAYRQLGKDETLTVDRYSGLTVITGRELLQDIGAALREVDRKFWLRVWRQDYFEIQRMGYGVVIALATALCFSLATPIARILGKTGINVMTRLMGLILAALAVEVMTDGLHKLFPVLARGI
jgi:hypothetical protein